MTGVKPDCYSCRWRRDLPGDEHSACHHPSNVEILANPLANLLGILASARKIPVPSPSTIKVVGHPSGIKNGWFNYPFNFDPVWLQECEGYERKEEKK